MSNKSFVIATLTLVALIVYLFVSAPPELPEDNLLVGSVISYETALAIAEAENDVVRALWTKEIVGEGQKVGLIFDEDWRSAGVEAGPLPALFLRETAASLEKNRVRLNLFLGSDFPINDANRFEDIQKEKFELLKQTQEPQFFYAGDIQLYTAMFPDLAVAEACINCHNAHKESPKDDWKLGDVMGAVTWSYSNKSLTLDELTTMLAALRQGFRDAYRAYLTKVEKFSDSPEVGNKWPKEGYYLPSIDVFTEEAFKRASPYTLEAILNLDSISESNED